MKTQRQLAALALALVVLPFAMRAIGMTESLGTEIALFALVGLGFNLLLGYTGLLSFGHGLFFGFAAYAAALSQLHWFRDGLFLPMLFAVTATSLLGLIVGFFVLRRRGVYFSLLTLAFTALAFFIAFRWTEFTGGESGLRGVTRPVLGTTSIARSGRLASSILTMGVAAATMEPTSVLTSSTRPACVVTMRSACWRRPSRI